jgi:Tol biopolymer transport system component
MTDAVARLATALADRYRLERELGQGGMATVYLAEDLKHRRPVAIKVLRPELAAVLGADRFVQEITTTAALQHPHILPLFDSGSADGFLYYVMPYVEGETLRTKLDREKQLGIEEGVRITTEVADALDYAHRHGVIHRDIKPENILLHDGRPMVADFGIALAVSAAAGGRMTETGMSLGTPHYMSPEQATAEKEITGRSDVYSLASVLYEMLAGQPPHLGGSAQQIIMKIIAEPVAVVTTLRKSVPPNVAAALARALEKLPADRFESAKAFAEALQNPAFHLAESGAAGAPDSAAFAAHGWRGRLRDPLFVGVFVVAVAAIAALLARRAPPVPSALPPIRFVLTTSDSAKPLDNDVWPGAISPDGGTVVYTAVAPDGQPMFYSLHTNELEAHPVPGTADAYEPYFSPDGTWLAFEQRGEERKVRLDGSTPVTITGGGVEQNGAAWTLGGQIVIGSFGSFQGLSHVSAGGGAAVALTRVDSARGERQHVWPIATPNPNVVVFTVWYGGLESSKLAAAALDDGHVIPLGVSGIRPLAVLDGHLVYVQVDGSVMAVPLDLRYERVTGAPVPVHDRVGVNHALNGNSEIYVSSGGALLTGNAGSSGRLVWLSRDGTTRPAVPEARDYTWNAPSPNGQRIAAVVSDNQGSDVYIWDATVSTFSRLTTAGAVSSVAWTRDGSSVVYVASDSGSQYAVWSQPVTGGSAATKLFSGPDQLFVAAPSPDGASLVVQAFRGSWDLLRIRLDSTPVARPYLTTRFDEAFPRFSPDGKWVAYTSNETGGFQVYVSSFPDASKKIQISAGQGFAPVWSADGSRLYYVSNAGGHATLLDARISLSPAFRLLGRDPVVSLGGRASFFGGLSPDGTRVLAVDPVSMGYRLEVSPNWSTEMRSRLAASGDAGKR